MKNKHDVLDAVLDALSNVSGETKEEINKILESVKSNLEKLNNCKLHRFGKIKYKSGYNYQCLNCGGKMILLHIRMYANGYKAAGKNPNDIFELIA